MQTIIRGKSVLGIRLHHIQSPPFDNYLFSDYLLGRFHTLSNATRSSCGVKGTMTGRVAEGPEKLGVLGGEQNYEERNLW